MSNDFQELLEAIKIRYKHINEYILDHVSLFIKPAQPLQEAAMHYFKAGGKGLRPAMLLLTSGAVHGDELIEPLPEIEQKAIPAGAAIEIIHTMSLIHDDIMDNDPTRRGVPAVHKKWDLNTAILAGDALLAMANKTLLETPVHERTKLFLSEELSKVFMGLCEGQQHDISFETRDPTSLTVDDIFDMQYKKTGLLFTFSVKAGAIIAKDDPYAPEVKYFEEYAKNLGIAFQIQDDILGLIGEESTLKKPVGSDIINGKRTIPIIHAFQHGTQKQLQVLKKAFQNPQASKEDINESINILQEIGSIQYTIDLSNKLANNAIHALEQTKLTNKKIKLLRSFPKYVITRIK